MSEIDMIIQKHWARMMNALSGGGYVKENADAAFIMQAAVCEAVEAERGRVKSAAMFALGKAGVYPEQADRIQQIIDDELTTDSEGAGSQT